MKYNSEANQDEFVFNILEYKSDGYFIDIGSCHPTVVNNTYFLESVGWQGLCFDKQNWDYSCRKCKFFNYDVLKIDLSKLFEDEKVPNIIDYLSVDIDDDSADVMEKLPIWYGFRVITIEHDFYRLGNKLKDREQDILKNRGYYLICNDVRCLPVNGYFEDWWVNPKFIDMNKFHHILSDKLLGSDIINKFTINRL